MGDIKVLGGSNKTELNILETLFFKLFSVYTNSF